MEHEKVDRIDNAISVLELIENDLWPRATESQKLSLVRLLAVRAAVASPPLALGFVGKTDANVGRRRYRLKNGALVPIK